MNPPSNAADNKTAPHTTHLNRSHPLPPQLISSLHYKVVELFHLPIEGRCSGYPARVLPDCERLASLTGQLADCVLD